MGALPVSKKERWRNGKNDLFSFGVIVLDAASFSTFKVVKMTVFSRAFFVFEGVSANIWMEFFTFPITYWSNLLTDEKKMSFPLPKLCMAFSLTQMSANFW